MDIEMNNDSENFAKKIEVLKVILKQNKKNISAYEYLRYHLVYELLINWKKKIWSVRKLHLLLQEKSLIKDHIVQKELENRQKVGLKMKYCQYQCKVIIKKQNHLLMMKILLKK